jgi:hypothetical protein
MSLTCPLHVPNTWLTWLTCLLCIPSLFLTCWLYDCYEFQEPCKNYIWNFWVTIFLTCAGSRGAFAPKRAHIAQRREGPKAQPTAGAPAPGSRVSVSLPLCVRYIFELFYAFCMHIYLKSYYQVQKFCLSWQLSWAVGWLSLIFS